MLHSLRVHSLQTCPYSAPEGEPAPGFQQLTLYTPLDTETSSSMTSFYVIISSQADSQQSQGWVPEVVSDFAFLWSSIHTAPSEGSPPAHTASGLGLPPEHTPACLHTHTQTLHGWLGGGQRSTTHFPLGWC